jgi:hypothetical protein
MCLGMVKQPCVRMTEVIAPLFGFQRGCCMRFIEWGVKDSFLDYLSSMPDHEIHLEGVGRDAQNDRFRFPFTPEAGAAVVRFRAHNGALDIMLRGLSIVHDNGGYTLTSAGDTAEPVAIARLQDGPASAMDLDTGWTFDDVALTIDGSVLFGGFYNPWTRMAAVVVGPV